MKDAINASQWVLVLVILLLGGCSSKLIVKNCEHIANDIWECEKVK